MFWNLYAKVKFCFTNDAKTIKAALQRKLFKFVNLSVFVPYNMTYHCDGRSV